MQVWKLSSVDLCEVARNSVLQSSFPNHFKAFWIGQGYRQLPSPSGNDIHRTNVPNIRCQYRELAHHEEMRLVFDAHQQQLLRTAQLSPRQAPMSNAIIAAKHRATVVGVEVPASPGRTTSTSSRDTKPTTPERHGGASTRYEPYDGPHARLYEAPDKRASFVPPSRLAQGSASARSPTSSARSPPGSSEDENTLRTASPPLVLPPTSLFVAPAAAASGEHHSGAGDGRVLSRARSSRGGGGGGAPPSAQRPLWPSDAKAAEEVREAEARELAALQSPLVEQIERAHAMAAAADAMAAAADARAEAAMRQNRYTLLGLSVVAAAALVRSSFR